MKIYIAASFARKDEVREIQKLFMREGHQIAADWTLHKAIKPYNENRETALDYSVEEADAILNSDVFVLLADSKYPSYGHKVELGIAMGSHLIKGKPMIYVIGETSETHFYYHPAVNHRESIKEVLEEINRGEA